jgi:adenylosuccinate synthase
MRTKGNFMDRKKTAFAVIGAGYGDEGKGLATDYFVKTLNVTAQRVAVVRYNGGSQAAHTVVDTDGKRNVFHGLNSGSFSGAATILGPEFIFNPIVFCDEYEKFESKYKTHPLVYVDPACRVTLPIDMLINQFVETTRSRDGRHHGSCGIGINETVTRHEAKKWHRLSFSDLSTLSREEIFEFLDASVDLSLERIESLGFSRKDYLAYLRNIDLVRLAHHFYAACDKSKNTFLTMKASEAVRLFDGIVFEGAQGLLLDEEHRFFPHVTRSKTGLRNLLSIAEEGGINEIYVNYITRTYATRHGAGPFSTENGELTFEDATNKPNAFQGSLRFGWLDFDLMAEAIKDDERWLQNANVAVRSSLFVTCCDQMQDYLQYAEWSWKAKNGSEMQDFNVLPTFLAKMQEAIGLPVLRISYGPKAVDVRKIAL